MFLTIRPTKTSNSKNNRRLKIILESFKNKAEMKSRKKNNICKNCQKNSNKRVKKKNKKTQTKGKQGGKSIHSFAGGSVLTDNSKISRSTSRISKNTSRFTNTVSQPSPDASNLIDSESLLEEKNWETFSEMNPKKKKFIESEKLSKRKIQQNFNQPNQNLNNDNLETGRKSMSAERVGSCNLRSRDFSDSSMEIVSKGKRGVVTKDASNSTAQMGHPVLYNSLEDECQFKSKTLRGGDLSESLNISNRSMSFSVYNHELEQLENFMNMEKASIKNQSMDKPSYLSVDDPIWQHFKFPLKDKKGKLMMLIRKSSLRNIIMKKMKDKLNKDSKQWGLEQNYQRTYSEIEQSAQLNKNPDNKPKFISDANKIDANEEFRRLLYGHEMELNDEGTKIKVNIRRQDVQRNINNRLKENVKDRSSKGWIESYLKPSLFEVQNVVSAYLPLMEDIKCKCLEVSETTMKRRPSNDPKDKFQNINNSLEMGKLRFNNKKDNSVENSSSLNSTKKNYLGEHSIDSEFKESNATKEYYHNPKITGFNDINSLGKTNPICRNFMKRKPERNSEFIIHVEENQNAMRYNNSEGGLPTQKLNLTLGEQHISIADLGQNNLVVNSITSSGEILEDKKLRLNEAFAKNGLALRLEDLLKSEEEWRLFMKVNQESLQSWMRRVQSAGKEGSLKISKSKSRLKNNSRIGWFYGVFYVEIRLTVIVLKSVLI